MLAIRLTAALVAVLVLSSAAVAQRPPADLFLEDVFERTATWYGRSYHVARDLLTRQGKAAVPFLRERLKSADPVQRDLAAAILLRIEHPEKVQAVERLLLFEPKLSYRKDGTVLVKWDPKEIEYRKNRKEPVTADDVILGRDVLPAIHDILRSEMRDMGRVPRAAGYWLRLVGLMQHFAAPQSVPVLLQLYDKHERAEGSEAAIVEALVALGEPALPPLREAVKSGKTPLAFAGARVLSRVGAKDDVALLVQGLRDEKSPQLVEEYAAALVRLRAKEAVPALLGRLVASAESAHEPDRRGRESSYAVLRRAVLELGKEGRDYLKERSKGGAKDYFERSALLGLMFELDHPDRAAQVYRAFAERSGHVKDKNDAEKVAQGAAMFWSTYPSYRGDGQADADDLAEVPGPLLVERAALAARPADLLELTRRKGEGRAFETVAWSLLGDLPDPRVYPGGAAPVIRGLANFADERALSVWQRLALYKPAGGREQDAVAIVEGIVALGSPKGAALLEEIAGSKNFSKPAAELARAVLPLLQGEKGAAHKLLGSDNAAVREAVAVMLARRGEAAAVPQLVLAAAKERGTRHANTQGAIVAAGQNALAQLRKLGKASDDWRVRLLCEACILRIERPQLYSELARAAAAQDYGFGYRSAPSAHSIKNGGVAVARAIGKDALPLFEAAMAFDCGPIPSVAAVFAVSHFKQDRSLPVLVQSMRSPHLAAAYWRTGGEALVPLALVEYGEKGAEAAKNVPPPDPKKEDYGDRTSRHGGATEALALMKEPQGVDNILEGLARPMPPKEKAAEFQQWRAMTLAYLRFALKYRDRRLVEPALKLTKLNDEEMTLAALMAAAGYKDPRLVQLATYYIDRRDRERGSDAGLAALVRDLGDGAVDYLIARSQKGAKASTRHIAVEALVKLGAWGGGAWEPHHADAAARDKAATAVRERLVPLLIESLKEQHTGVQDTAALALVTLTAPYGHSVSDRRPVKPLCAWLKQRKYATAEVARYLVAAQDPDAAGALLAAYRAGNTDPYMVAALAELRVAEVVPDLTAAAGAPRFDKYEGIPAIRALVRMGPKGHIVAREALTKSPLLAVRVEAAVALSREDADSLAPTLALFEELTSNELWHAGLQQKGSDRAREYTSHLDQMINAVTPHWQKTFPAVCYAFLRSTDGYNRWQLENWIYGMATSSAELRDVPVPLARRPAHFAAHGDNLPKVRLLEMADLWHKVVRNGGRSAKELKSLEAESELALEALVEMCYPRKGPLTAEQVAAAVKQLDAEESRPRALALLAFGNYPQRHLTAALTAARGAALQYGRAVHRWRGQDPWFAGGDHKLLWAATEILHLSWPVDKMRAFALKRLDRLAEVEAVEHDTFSRPLMPLLASVRYSPSAEERERLSDFARRARPGARETAAHVMQYGMTASTRPGITDHWGALPAHTYKP